MKMEMGNHIQSIIEDKLQKAGLWMGSEKRIWIPKFRISGRTDIWAWDPESLKPGKSRVPVLIEVKSISGRQEGGIIRPVRSKLMPKEDHVCQVVPYLDFYSQFPGYFHGSPVRVVLFEISRESMKFKEHVVFLGGKGQHGMPLDKDERYAIVRNDLGTYQLKFISVRGVYGRWAKLADHLKKGELPPRDFEMQYDNDKLAILASKEVLDREKMVRSRKKDPDGKGLWLEKGDWQCRYCDYRTKCWEGIDHASKPVIKQTNPVIAESAPPPTTEPVGSI
jgi:hypothetical protein